MTLKELQKYFSVSTKKFDDYYVLSSLTEKGRWYPSLYQGHFKSYGNGKFGFDNETPTSNLTKFLEQQKRWLNSLKYHPDCYRVGIIESATRSMKFQSWLDKYPFIYTNSHDTDNFFGTNYDPIHLILNDCKVLSLDVELENLKFSYIKKHDGKTYYGSNKFDTLEDLFDGILTYFGIYSFEMLGTLVPTLEINPNAIDLTAIEVVNQFGDYNFDKSKSFDFKEILIYKLEKTLEILKNT